MDQEMARQEEAHWKKQKFILAIIAMAIIGAVVIISILRERIVSPPQDRVTVYGQGKVEYVPDEATVTLGVQVPKTQTSQEALNQLNQKMQSVISAIKGAGVDEKDIKTETYSLTPQYDYTGGKSTLSGYSASQNLEIKARNIKKKDSLVSNIIQAGSSQGANQIGGVDYSVTDLESLKQEARVKAIEDAKSKSGELFQAAGLRPGKVAGWHENSLYYPGMANGGGRMEANVSDALSSKQPTPPEVPSGTQEVTVEVGVDYQVN